MKTHYVLNTSSLNILSPLRATLLAAWNSWRTGKTSTLGLYVVPWVPEYVVRVSYLNLKNV